MAIEKLQELLKDIEAKSGVNSIHRDLLGLVEPLFAVIAKEMGGGRPTARWVNDWDGIPAVQFTIHLSDDRSICISMSLNDGWMVNAVNRRPTEMAPYGDSKLLVAKGVDAAAQNLERALKWLKTGVMPE